MYIIKSLDKTVFFFHIKDKVDLIDCLNTHLGEYIRHFKMFTHCSRSMIISALVSFYYWNKSSFWYIFYVIECILSYNGIPWDRIIFREIWNRNQSNKKSLKICIASKCSKMLAIFVFCFFYVYPNGFIDFGRDILNSCHIYWVGSINLWEHDKFYSWVHENKNESLHRTTESVFKIE